MLVEAILFQGIDIVDFAHGGNGETSQVGVDHHRLRLGVTDNTDTNIACHLVEILRELWTEMRVLDVVDVLVGLVTVKGSHTGTFGAKMRMIIGSVEQI